MTGDDHTPDDLLPADPSGAAPLWRAEGTEISLEDFRAGFGEELQQTLNMATWRTGGDLSAEYHRLEAEVRLAVERETDYQKRIRTRVLPRLACGEGAPRGAGTYQVSVDEIAAIHRGLLFNGGVEACDGTHHLHDTLPLTIHQVGVSLVSYRGDCGTWHQRLFRRDLRVHNGDPVADILDLLERRTRRGGLHQPTPCDLLSELAQRAIMSYAERAILLQHSTAPWRMGHGCPAPLELLTGGGSPDLMVESVRVIRELVEGHQKFVFIASEPGDRALFTLGQSLRPLEFAIVTTLRERMYPFLERLEFRLRPTVDTTWDGQKLTPEQWVRRFRDEVAARVVVGLYRATPLAPAQLFYAHVDHADVAARVALADSVLQEQRGFPMLIDLADQMCRSVYGGGSLQEMTAAAYAAAGAPWRYLSERLTRNR